MFVHPYRAMLQTLQAAYQNLFAVYHKLYFGSRDKGQDDVPCLCFKLALALESCGSSGMMESFMWKGT